MRPKPLGSGFFAFLWPHVPLVPSVPTDVSDAGKSPVDDAKLFPSDEEMSQRAIWIAFLIVLGWNLLGLTAALPIYMVSTPCLAQSTPTSTFGPVYSTLHDLSLLRLLQALDSNDGSQVRLRIFARESSPDSNLRVRIIVIAAILIFVGLIPSLWKLLHEFTRMVAFRKRWIEVHCENQEMGWLSAKKAPGFTGWGEKRLKDFILKTGLSSTLEHRVGRNGSRYGLNDHRSQRTGGEIALLTEEDGDLEIDIQKLFTIGYV